MVREDVWADDQLTDGGAQSVVQDGVGNLAQLVWPGQKRRDSEAEPVDKSERDAFLKS